MTRWGRRARARVIGVGLATVVTGLVLVAGGAAAGTGWIAPYNGSFESSLQGWAFSNATAYRVSDAAAPLGSNVGLVRADGAGDVAVSTTPGYSSLSAGGATYSASIQARAGNAAAVGAKAFLVVREWRDGVVVEWAGPQRALTSSFASFSASGRVRASGDRVVVRLVIVQPAAGATVRFDAATLRAKVDLPVTNSLSQSSGWSGLGASISSQQWQHAADGDGTIYAQATGSARAGAVQRLTGSPIVGEQYVGSAYVAAGTGAVGKVAAVDLVETRSGAVVQRARATVTLQAALVRVQAQLRPRYADSTLSLEVTLLQPTAGNGLRIDAAQAAPVAPTVSALAISRSGTDSSTQADTLGAIERYRYVVGQPYDFATHSDDNVGLTRLVRSRNPYAKTLVYTDPAATQPRDCSGYEATGSAYSWATQSLSVDYCWIVANHPEWLMYTSADPADRTPASWSDSGWLPILVDSPGYPELAARNAVDLATHLVTVPQGAATTGGLPADGLWLDDIGMAIHHGLDGATVYRCVDTACSAKEQVDLTGYGARMATFMERFMAQARSLPAGQRLFYGANLYAFPWNTEQVPSQMDSATRVASVVDLANRENTVQWADHGTCGPFGPMDGGALSLFEDAARTFQALPNKPAMSFVEYGATPAASSDYAAMRLSRAMFLLTWNGRPGSTSFFRPCGDVTPDNTNWMTEIGLPAGGISHPAAGVDVRRYTGGLVVVNRTGGAKGVALDGRYKDTVGNVHEGWVSVPGGDPAGDSDLAAKAVILVRY